MDTKAKEGPEYAIGSLRDLSHAGDNYRTYEGASAIEAEITNTLAQGPGRGPARCGQLQRPRQAARGDRPREPGKAREPGGGLRLTQVVHGVLKANEGAQRRTGAQKLFAIALDGLLEARKRKSSPFHIQRVAAIAICALCEEDEGLFISLSSIAAKPEKAFEIKETQEGTWQPTTIMTKMAPGPSKRPLDDPDVQLELMKSRHPPIINWTMHLDEVYRHEMIPGKRAYNVRISAA